MFYWKMKNINHHALMCCGWLLDWIIVG